MKHVQLSVTYSCHAAEHLLGICWASAGHLLGCQEYKRQLGHRIYTREEFLQRLRLERGAAADAVGEEEKVECCTIGLAIMIDF